MKKEEFFFIHMLLTVIKAENNNQTGPIRFPLSWYYSSIFGMVPAEVKINEKAQTKCGPSTEKFLNLILRVNV